MTMARVRWTSWRLTAVGAGGAAGSALDATGAA